METDPQRNKRAIRDVWRRGMFMLLFLIAFSVAEVVLYLVTIVQFIWMLATGEANYLLQRFGRSLSIWISEVVRFLTCVSEEMPFPSKDWPAPPDE